MDCSLPGSSVHGIFQARILEWGAIAFSTWTLTRIQIYREDDKANSLLLQGIFPTQGSNPGLLYCRQILYQLSYKLYIKCLKLRHLSVSLHIFHKLFPFPLAPSYGNHYFTFWFLFLDSTYTWYHTAVFFCLAYFTQHNALHVHPWQNFLLFKGWIIFCFKFSSFICLQVFRLFLHLDYCE